MTLLIETLSLNDVCKLCLEGESCGQQKGIEGEQPAVGRYLVGAFSILSSYNGQQPSTYKFHILACLAGGRQIFPEGKKSVVRLEIVYICVMP